METFNKKQKKATKLWLFNLTIDALKKILIEDVQFDWGGDEYMKYMDFKQRVVNEKADQLKIHDLNCLATIANFYGLTDEAYDIKISITSLLPDVICYDIILSLVFLAKTKKDKSNLLDRLYDVHLKKKDLLSLEYANIIFLKITEADDDVCNKLFEDAISLLKTHNCFDSRYVQINYVFGNKMGQEGEFAKAIILYDEALSKIEDKTSDLFFKISLVRGQTILQGGDKIKGAEALSQCLILKPNDREVNIALVDVFAMMSYMDKAIYDFNKRGSNELKYDGNYSVLVEDEEFLVPDIFFEMSGTMSDILEDTNQTTKIPLPSIVTKAAFKILNSSFVYGAEFFRRFMVETRKQSVINTEMLYKFVINQKIHINHIVELVNICNFLDLKLFLDAFFSVYRDRKRLGLAEELTKIKEEYASLDSKIHKDVINKYIYGFDDINSKDLSFTYG